MFGWGWVGVLLVCVMAGCGADAPVDGADAPTPPAPPAISGAVTVVPEGAVAAPTGDGEELLPEGTWPKMAYDVAQEKMAAPRPDLAKMTSPAVAAAIQDPDALWRFLIAPQTSYLDRRAAAVQGAKVFPLKWLSRLMTAHEQLRAEQALHEWGLKPHPCWAYSIESYAGFRAHAWPAAERTRHILGATWQVPTQRTDHPLTWEEEAAAPWPWQVAQALGDLYSHLLPDNLDEAPIWLAATLEMPCTTDAEASRFVEASAGSTHCKTVAVLARWRQIALTKAFPQAATAVASHLGEAIRLWDDPQSHALGQVIAVDILTQSPHKEARQRAAYALPSMVEGYDRDGHTVRLPLPATAVLATSRLALDPAQGDTWTRLYCYGFATLATLEQPPFKPDWQMDPAGAQPVLDRFAAWFAENKPALTAAAAKEAAALDVARAALDAAAPKP